MNSIYLFSTAVLMMAGCQTNSKKDAAEPFSTDVSCANELLLECEEGQVDRCTLFDTGIHECVKQPSQVVFKCSEPVGYHCPEGEVDRCTFDADGNHDCVPDPRLAKDFPKPCEEQKELTCPEGQVDSCQLNPDQERKCVPFQKEYLVKFRSEQSLRLATTELPSKVPGAKTLGQYLKGRFLRVTLPTNDVVMNAMKLSRIFDEKSVEYVVENLKVKAIGTPNDSRFSEQWSHAKTNAVTAWSQTTGNKEIVVAVIDTGVDYKHNDLKDNIYVNNLEIKDNGIDDDGNGFIDDYYGWDFFDDDNDPMDETSSGNSGHGTHCAGIVGAVGNNGIGITGASQKVSIMPVRFLGPRGEGGLAGAVRAVDYAVENGADIISASFGVNASASQVRPLLEAIERARDKGVLFVAAASNDGRNNDSFEIYPANAAYSNIISVAASDTADGKPSWSNFGKKVSLAAPGKDILSTLPDNKYGELSGTSMATPYVAGAAALLMSKNIDLVEDGVNEAVFSRQITSTPENIKSLLQASGSPVSINTACQCRLDMGSAFTALNGSQLLITPASGHLIKGDEIQLKTLGGDGNYSYTAQPGSVLSVNASGLLSALGEGAGTVTVNDGAGKSVESFAFQVSSESGGASGSCPLSWPRVCSIICYFVEGLNWCQ